MFHLDRRSGASIVFRAIRLLWVILHVLLAASVAAFGQWRPPGDNKPPFHHKSNSNRVSQPDANGTSANKLGSASLTVRCNMDCTISTDNGWKIPLFAGRSRTLSVQPGKHSFFAVSADGRRKWQTTLVLAKSARKNLVIPLIAQQLKLSPASVAERNEIMAEITRVQAQIEANRQKTAELQSGRKKLVEELEARKQRQNDLQRKAYATISQIKSYETQVEQEFKQADLDEKEAQQDYNIAMYGAGRNSTLGNIAAVTGSVASSAKRLSADRHRQRAQQLTAEMDKLSRELYALTKPQ